MLDYKVRWLVEGRVIHIVIQGEYDPVVTQEGLADVKRFIESGTAPVHLIMDSTGITKMPKSLRDLINQMGSMRDLPKGGWIVIISDSVMLRFAGQIATTFVGATYRSVETFDEAVETLCRVDPTVTDALQQAVSTKLP